jgi:hypothetical protein
MRCQICGQEREDDSLSVLSYKAYLKINTLLKNNLPKVKKAVLDENPPVYICSECIMSVYQLKRMDPVG